MTNCRAYLVARNRKKPYAEQENETAAPIGTVGTDTGKERIDQAMILADKLMNLRKKNGWSQEELADLIGVSRQAVSKWEGAQSVPDLEKILRLSQLFGVTTDYLLKDELEEAEYVAGDDAQGSVRRVSLEEAHAFLAIKRWSAGRISLGVFLCILSPCCLFLLLGALESGYPISEALACGGGLIALLLFVAGAVALFITSGSKTAPFEYLEKEPFETEYGVVSMVREQQTKYRPTNTKLVVIGICFCILSIVPLLFGAFLAPDAPLLLLGLLCCTLLLCAIGVVFLVWTGIRWESMKKLLQEGEYTPKRKALAFPVGAFTTVYWLLVVAIFLVYNVLAQDQKNGWLIWAVAGVLYGALAIVLEAVQSKKQ